MSIKSQLLNCVYFIVTLAVLWFIFSRFLDNIDALIVSFMVVILQSFLMLAPQIKQIVDDKIGPPVKDCGPNPHWPGYLVGAVIFLLIGIAIIPVYLWGIVDDLVYLLTGIIMCACFSQLCLLMAISRLELRKDGIRYYFGVVFWNSIKSYTWAGTYGNTLKCKSKIMAWTMTGSMRIPVEFKDDFDAAFRENGVPYESL